jgi:hypothetical protein
MIATMFGLQKQRIKGIINVRSKCLLTIGKGLNLVLKTQSPSKNVRDALKHVILTFWHKRRGVWNPLPIVVVE